MKKQEITSRVVTLYIKESLLENYIVYIHTVSSDDGIQIIAAMKE